MPIYEYYSPDTNKIYKFFAKTLAQKDIIPKCPDGEEHRMEKMLSGFAIITLLLEMIKKSFQRI